jgi:hypothetical protein
MAANNDFDGAGFSGILEFAYLVQVFRERMRGEDRASVPHRHREGHPHPLSHPHPQARPARR